MYPGAVDVWTRNFGHVAQLFGYGSAIRKVMYTTNAVESAHSSFRKVTKQGAFPNENALLKLLYLRITELYAKWNGSSVQNWAMARNKLMVNSKIQTLMQKYENMIWRKKSHTFLDIPFTEGNIPLLVEPSDKYILRAYANGKPEYLQQNVGGVTYKAVKVGDKIYIPNN